MHSIVRAMPARGQMVGEVHEPLPLREKPGVVSDRALADGPREFGVPPRSRDPAIGN